MKSWAWSLLCYAGSSHGQSLLQAISSYSQLTNFSALLTKNPNLAGALLTTNTSILNGESTILIPDNSAFNKVSALYNVSMSNLTINQLEPYLQYHLLVGNVTSTNLTAPEGITTPSYLTGETFNNRSAGAALGASSGNDKRNGQVVFLQPKLDSSTKRSNTIIMRQAGGPKVNAQGGLGHQINLTAVDGRWDGGYFQIVDKFLSLPLNCTESIKRWRMNSFRGSLDRLGIGNALDITRNVTCFTPNDDAFLSAGSPHINADAANLQGVIERHVAQEPFYSNFLVDGQIIRTFDNSFIRVKLSGRDIFFNDAKVLNKNVMTNNGLMYVLDKVMTPLNESQISTGSIPANRTGNVPFATATASGAGSSSTASSAAGRAIHGFPTWAAIVMIMIGLLFACWSVVLELAD